MMRPLLIGIAVLVCSIIPSLADDGDFAQAIDLTRAGKFQDAAPLLQRLADEGNPYASLTLAEFYQKGSGVPQDQEKAAKLCETAAMKNVVTAQRITGQLYDLGQGVTKDQTRAVFWFRKAAEADDVNSQLRLGNAYQSGEGVKQDRAEAMKWFKRAASQDVALAEFEVANLYAEQNEKAEIEWTRKAADHGFPPALYSLGFAYSIGHGVPTNLTEAYRLLTLAAVVAAKSPIRHFPPPTRWPRVITSPRS